MEDAMGAADPLQQGSLLAERYRIGERIGAGGMASVHRATDEVLGREVAVKAIVRESTDPADLQRERSEIDLLASLNHRALVTLFDAGSTTLDGLLVSYLVMELVDGPTLAARLAQGPLPQEQAWRIAHDLAEALVIVHASEVVHRDIKPANILLAPSLVPGRDFDAKLADFGIAAIVGAARLTATGTVLGTAAYLSPEQATGARVAPSSDIYSLGLVLLEALTGRREYPGPLLESLSARLARDPEIPGSIGYEWKSLLTAMTAREPEARPTAAAVLERLIEMAAAVATTGDIDATAALGSVATAAIIAANSGPAPVAAMAADRSTTAETLRSAAIAPEAGTADAATRGRRRRWAIAGGLAAGTALLVAVPAMALQAGDPTAPTVEPAVIESEPPAPSVVAPAPTEPAPTETAPAETAVADPAPAEPAPAAPIAPATVTTDGSTSGGGGTSGGGQGGASTGAENSGNENAGPGGGNGNGGGGRP
ncbi:serine/threonine-protein kinase [Agrococcus sediminis]|uniref:serine/threonine-protein kinase n=1 Tax=Agrococcus sediminis TaxID=2599924 RepID=UPI00342B43FD